MLVLLGIGLVIVEWIVVKLRRKMFKFLLFVKYGDGEWIVVVFDLMDEVF